MSRIYSQSRISSRLRFGLIGALSIATSIPSAMAVPVRLSINNSASVAIQNNAGAGANDLSIAYFAGNTPDQANRRLLQVRLADPMLCAEFANSQADSTVRFRLVDPNQLIQGNDQRGFRGLQPLVSDTGGIRLRAAGPNPDAIDVGKNLLRLSTQSFLPCYVFPGGALANVQPQGASGESNRAPDGGDLIFTNSFETALAAGIELVTTISVPTSARGGDPVAYVVRVDNVGQVGATGVQVRDFFMKPVAGSANPGLTDGNWTCATTGTAECSEGSGTGYIYQSNATIPSGASLIFATNKTLSNTTPPTVGSRFRIQAAAFSRPTDNEPNRANNAAASAQVEVVTNVAPTISGLTTRTFGEDTVSPAYAFTVNDPDNTGPLNVSASSSNPSIISSGGISLGGSGNNRTIQFTPEPNASGSAIITVAVNDGISTTTQGFSVIVDPVNDKPAFVFSSACPNSSGMVFTAPNGATPATMTFPSGSQAQYTCGSALVVSFGPGESGQTVQEIVDLAVVSNGVLFANTANVTPNGAGASVGFGINGTSGVATVSFRIRDSGGVSGGGIDLSDVVTLRVRVPSATPTLSSFSNLSVNEDNATGAINFTVSDTDTPLTALQVNVSSSNTSLVPSLGLLPSSANSARSFVLTPAANAFGSSTITVTATDGDQTATQTFLLTVNSVNDAPTFQNTGNVEFPTGTTSGIKQINNWASSLSVGPVNEQSTQVVDQFVVEVLNDDNAILSGTPPSVSTVNGRLTFNLRSNGGQAFTGFACLRVILLDSGDGTPPNINQSAPVVMKIRVNGADGICNTSLLRAASKR